MKLVRNVGLYLGHLLTAVIGTAILSTGFGKLLHPTTIIGVIWKEWIIDITVAGTLGLLACRISRSRLGSWVWILPALWFGLRVLSLVPTNPVHGNHPNSLGLWYEISGQDCVMRASDSGCVNFLAYTIPFIRSVTYSLAAMIGARFLAPPPTKTSDATTTATPEAER
jgi:hypothetical protein